VDLVTGSPYHPDGTVLNVPAWRLSLSKGASFLYRRVLRQKLHTYTSCFRVYRRSALLDIDLRKQGFLGVAEMIGKLDIRGRRVREYPVKLEVRLLGRSKMRILNTICGHILVLLQLLWLQVSKAGAPQRAAGQGVMPASILPAVRSHLLGYPVDSLDMNDAVSVLGKFVQEQGLHHVVAINANKLWLAERTPPLKAIMKRAELVIPEYAVVWGCRMLRRPLKGHVGGVMLLKAVLPWLERTEIPVYFLGAKQSVLDQMQARIKDAHRRIVIAGAHCVYFEPSREHDIVKEINQSGAQILFVAMGSPRQELWIEKHRSELKVKVALGVGGSFDVLAGLKKDAPQWMRHGVEWLYRLAQDPKNLWKRYLTTNPWFVWRILHERVRGGGS
jgi:N-acetylglucosaminyldiphosphoundecaprenol N-acetyl-beta-D-mannosaminyltransferase